AETPAGAVAVRVLVQRQEREPGRLQGRAAEAASEREADERVPGAGAELDVLVREVAAPELERIVLGAPERDAEPQAQAGIERSPRVRQVQDEACVPGTEER